MFQSDILDFGQPNILHYTGSCGYYVHCHIRQYALRWSVRSGNLDLSNLATRTDGSTGDRYRINSCYCLDMQSTYLFLAIFSFRR